MIFHFFVYTAVPMYQVYTRISLFVFFSFFVLCLVSGAGTEPPRPRDANMRKFWVRARSGDRYVDKLTMCESVIIRVLVFILWRLDYNRNDC